VSDPLVRLRGVSRLYGVGDAEVRALDSVDMDIDRGEFIALMGPSGSGKSTALNVIGCLDVPSGGRYWFRGVEVGDLSGRQRALLRRNWLGFVFQSFNLLQRGNALENVELPLVYKGLGRRERQRLAMSALEEVGLADRARHRPNEMSGGQQQRVAIARALVTAPDLLLADEPTGNLDSVMSHDIMRLLAGLNRDRGITVAMVTHEDEMAEYTDRIVRFRDGRVEPSGPARAAGGAR